jgi:hypothetical protein
LSYKKRKLNNCFWLDDDKGNSEWNEKETRVIKEQEEIRWARLSWNLNIFKRVFAIKNWLYIYILYVWKFGEFGFGEWVFNYLFFLLCFGGIPTHLLINGVCRDSLREGDLGT